MRFKNMTVGKQQGELARFRVLGGPDSGVVFVITAPRVTMGRGDENDIILSDLKASRKHAEVTSTMGAFMIRDLGSSHGFLINGVSQKQLQLKNGDKIGLGETVMEFLGGTNVGATQMLVRNPDQVSKKVGTGNSGLTQFLQRPPASGGGATGPRNQGDSGSFIEKNKKLFLILALLMVGAGLLPQAENTMRRKKPNVYTSIDTNGEARVPAALAVVDYDAPAYKSADLYYRLGMRELRSKNYHRAMADFETASQIYENHPLARVYIATTRTLMDEDAKSKFEEARRDEAASRYRGAVNQYNYIKRLYDSDQSHKNYRDAEAKVTEIEKKMKDMEKIQ